MSFFSPKKPASAAQKPAKKRDVVTMICPYCRHEQIESRIAVSTYCRGCGSHYEMVGGKAVAGRSSLNNPFGTSEQGKENKRDLPGNTTLCAPTNNEALANGTDQGIPTHQGKHRTADFCAQISKKVTTAGNLFQKKNLRREVQCLECEHRHEAPVDATSTLCPVCGAYVSLKNHIINGHWNRRIKTRGNVTIQKKGVVTDITIHCHNILVQGSLKGGIDCSGDVTLNSSSNIMGKLSCKRLIIQKKADVAFANEVHCEEAIIDGHVTGNFICSGKLHLKKKAVLNGNITVARMVIDKGARHHGNITIRQ